MTLIFLFAYLVKIMYKIYRQITYLFNSQSFYFHALHSMYGGFSIKICAVKNLPLLLHLKVLS